MHLVLGLSYHYFLSTFSTFSTWFISCQITITIDTLWAQLLLVFYTNHFETMHTYSTWSVDVHVVLGLSSLYFLLLFFFYFFDLVFSSPELKAQGELL